MSLNRKRPPKRGERTIPRLLAIVAWLSLAALPACPALAQVVINELMYNPYEPWGTTNNTEYVELYNAGTNAVDLSDYRFDNGIDYRFPYGTVLQPNAFIVVCEDLFAFQGAYPAVSNAVGNFGGGLRNSGERVTLSRLSNDTWVTVDTIEYVDTGPADGDGPSLELVNPGFYHLDEHYPGAWKSSEPIASSRGTPGASNSVYNAAPPPAIGDVAHDPPFPPANSALKVTCRARAVDGNPPEVYIQYRKDALDPGLNRNTNEWCETPMWDCGYNGDDVTNDFVFTAIVPTNGSLEAMANNDVMEFRIRAVDFYGRTNLSPFESWAGVSNQPLSYLCRFGDDVDFTGEYVTYYTVTTKSNLTGGTWGLTKRDPYSDFLLDCTCITSDGHIYYNSGIRKRGDSRVADIQDDYRVDLPDGRDHDGYGKLSFFFATPFNDYFGMTVASKIGHGNIACDVKLVRFFINDTFIVYGQNGCVCRTEAIDGDYFSSKLGTDNGNYYYVNKKPYGGTLAYYADINTYSSYSGTAYGCDPVNTNAAYYEMQEFTRRLTQPGDVIRTNLPLVCDCRAVARQCAFNVAMDNNESGYLCPVSQYPDEGRFYFKEDGRFMILPWDYDSTIGSSAWVWTWQTGGYPGAAFRAFLYNLPTLPYYGGDCVDIMTNTLTDANINEIFAGMGSLMTSATRASWLSALQAQRINIKAVVKTNFAAAVVGAAAQGPLAAVVTASPISITGSASQAYVQYVRVNGTAVPWTQWTYDGNIATTWGLWGTNSFALSNTCNNLVIQEIGGRKDNAANVLRTKNLAVILKSSSTDVSGAISSSASWSGGIYVITGNVTVNSPAVLTIAANTTVLFNPGTKLSASSGAMISIEGTKTGPVNFYPSDGSSSWTLEAAAGSVITGAYLRAAGGIVTASGATGVMLSRCWISDFTKNTFSSAPLLVDECLFENMTDCGIELASSPAATVVRRTTVRNSKGAGSVDGVRITGASAGLVTNCLFETLSGNGVESSVSSSGFIVSKSLFRGCDAGVDASAGSTIVNHNNTIVNCAAGIRGANATTYNMIIWSNTASAVGGPATITYSDAQTNDASVYPGTANINRNPWFRGIPDNDYSLLTVSPCIGAASGGGNMGASFPVGANPAAPTNLSATNNGATQILLRWQDNSGTEENSFAVERSIDGEEWQTATSAAADATNCYDTGLVPSTLYHYRIRAAHERGVSLYSDVVAAMTAQATSAALLSNSLRITEIMYNPADSSSDAHEFLELKNISGSPLDLTGVFFSNGVDFHFTNGTTLAPGSGRDAFFVLAKSTNFSERYPGTNYNGRFENGTGLNNGGERLTIKDAASNTILSVQYDPAWYPSTDDGGYSLVLENTAGAPDEPETWRASSYVNGSPGMDDPASPLGSIIINEILAHTDPPLVDSIELYNAGINSVNIQNWYLSDNANNLKLYHITNSISIPSHDYYTFYATNSFGKDLTNGFLLSELGDEVWLASATGTNLTSYRTSEKFDATENGISIGRYVRSDGNLDFPPLGTVTLGASNSYPKVGPVVISEIMYNPGAGGKEFVELYNTASSNIQLFAGAGYPTNVWKLTGGLDYEFPTNTSMASGEYILVVGVLPEEFRQVTGLTNPAIRVFGPASGQLGNNGDTVNLVKPNQPWDHTNSWVQVDHVKFDDNLPWPELADNGGASLERRVLSEYGNDPTNWFAASVGGTPGASNNTARLPSVGFSPAGGDSYESNHTVYVYVTLAPAIAATVTVQYAVGGTATSGVDYAMSGGTLTFWPYDTQKILSMRILDDAVSNETDETVTVLVTNVSANAMIGGNRVYTHTITDLDAGTIPAPKIYADAVDITGGSKSFLDTVTVTMTTTGSAGTIYYTTDNSTPTASDNVYTGAFTVTSTTKFKARTFVGSYNGSATVSGFLMEQAPELILAPGNAILVRIMGGEDDAHEVAKSSTPRLYHPYMCLQNVEESSHIAGVRFRTGGLPPGVNVTNAFLQFTSWASSTGTPVITIFGEATNSSLPFATISLNITRRNKTSASCAWSVSQWPLADQRSALQRTCNIAPILTELAARPGWSATTPITIILTWTNYEGMMQIGSPVYSFDGNPAKVASLMAMWHVPEATNFWLGVVTNGVGTITGGNVWVDRNSNATLEASAPEFYRFAGWSGTVPPGDEFNNPLTLLMDRTRSVRGNFEPDVATNDTPKWWLNQYYPGTNNFDEAAMSDTDGDGYPAWMEYITDTDPTNGNSLLMMTAVRTATNTVNLSWQSSPARYYSIVCSSNLIKVILGKDYSWSDPPIFSGIPGSTSRVNTYYIEAPPDSNRYYRVETSY